MAETKAIALHSLWIKGGDAISQASNGSDNRYAAITHADQLVDATRLKAGGQQEDVSTSQSAGFIFLVKFMGGDYSQFFGMFFLHLLEKLDVPLVAFTQDNHLNIGSQERVSNFFDKVKTFLLHYPGGHNNNRHLIVYWQTENFLDIDFISLFSVKAFDIEFLDKAWICFWIIIIIINAIDNAKKLIFSILQYSVKVFAKVLGDYLFFVLF